MEVAWAAEAPQECPSKARICGARAAFWPATAEQRSLERFLHGQHTSGSTGPSSAHIRPVCSLWMRRLKRLPQHLLCSLDCEHLVQQGLALDLQAAPRALYPSSTSHSRRRLCTLPVGPHEPARKHGTDIGSLLFGEACSIWTGTCALAAERPAAGAGFRAPIVPIREHSLFTCSQNPSAGITRLCTWLVKFATTHT